MTGPSAAPGHREAGGPVRTESEQGHCPACGAPGIAGSRRVPDHEYGLAHRARYARCAQCASEYQHPMPALSELSDFYPAGYHSFGGGGRLQQLRHDLRIRRLAGLLNGPGAVLDYGCGDGSFALRAAEKLPEREWFGYEIGERPELQRLAGGRVTLVRGQLADLLAVLPPCRLVTMNHVIEHLPEPESLLASLCERLLPEGTLEGQTPVVGSLEHRLFGTRWSGYHAPRHTVIFSHAGLAALLERLRLESVALDPAFNPAGLALSLASLPHGDAPGVLPRQGLRWLACLGAATLLAPLDRLLGPAVVDFAARKAGA